MRRLLGWLGAAGFAVGLLLIAANVIMHFMGISASYNIGDPSSSKPCLISFWHIGIGLSRHRLASGTISRRL